MPNHDCSARLELTACVAAGARVAIADRLLRRPADQGQTLAMRETRSLELVAIDRPHTGAIAARLADEPALPYVQDVTDALMVALDRGVDLVVPRHIFDARRGDFPPNLPPYVRVV